MEKPNYETRDTSSEVLAIELAHLSQEQKQVVIELRSEMVGKFREIQETISDLVLQIKRLGIEVDLGTQASDQYQKPEMGPSKLFSFWPGIQKSNTSVTTSTGSHEHGNHSQRNRIRSLEANKVNMIEEKKALEKRCQRLSDKLDSAEQETKQFDEKNTDFWKQLEEAKSRLESAFAQVASLTATNETLEVQRDGFEEERRVQLVRVQELERANQKSQDEVAQFREIIASGSRQSGRVADGSIKVAFFELRQQIQYIANVLYAVDQSPTMSDSATYQQQEFFQQWKNGSLTNTQLRNRVRHTIFHMLYSEIFDRRCFGHEVSRADTLNGGLAKFEAALEKVEGHNADIAEWRSRTVECAGWFCDGSQSKWPLEVAIDIWRFMHPILSHEVNKSAAKVTKFQGLLIKLCEDAVQLTLRMRGSTDLYACRLAQVGKELIESEAEPQYSEPNDTELNKPIVFFNLFGALVKYSQMVPHGIVLEKAHVVIRDSEKDT